MESRYKKDNWDKMVARLRDITHNNELTVQQKCEMWYEILKK